MPQGGIVRCMLYSLLPSCREKKKKLGSSFLRSLGALIIISPMLTREKSWVVFGMTFVSLIILLSKNELNGGLYLRRIAATLELFLGYMGLVCCC
jgi:hypothetical protein